MRADLNNGSERKVELRFKGLPAADPGFQHTLASEDDFNIRRAVERLREGLFDPVAVRLLTAHEERLKAEVEGGLKLLDQGGCPHLCLVGAYGQGKSHGLLYIRDLAIRSGYATSRINLDPREVAFHDFRRVYRELITHLELPGPGGPFPLRWQTWARQQTKGSDNPIEALRVLVSEEMPHLFKTIFAAMASPDPSVPEHGKRRPQNNDLPSQQLPELLTRALSGEPVPVRYLGRIFKSCEVSFYKEGPLRCRGTAPFIRMIEALSLLFRQMGYRGWVLLFDEAEAIGQTRVTARSKAYRLLHHLFTLDASGPAFLYPVFAFTDDFFTRVQEEDYERSQKRGETSIPYFDRNYAREWRDLRIFRLHDLSKPEWEELATRLACLHARAYGWAPLPDRVSQELSGRLAARTGQETRLRLKSLVDGLDLLLQEQVL